MDPEDEILGMNGPYNKIGISGHAGPHPEVYHQWIYRRLENAIGTLEDDEASEAFLEELGKIGDVLEDPESLQHLLITK